MIFIIARLNDIAYDTRYLLFTESLYYAYQVIVCIKKIENKENRLTNKYYNIYYNLLLLINIILMFKDIKNIFCFIMLVAIVTCLLCFEVGYIMKNSIMYKTVSFGIFALVVWAVLYFCNDMFKEPLVISLFILVIAYMNLVEKVYSKENDN